MMMRPTLLTRFSGIQPTGIPHLGNYFGAIRRWGISASEPPPSRDQPARDEFYCVMDLHALTTRKLARENVLDTLATLMACKVLPREEEGVRVSLCVQSGIKQHTELFWILSCVTPIGLLQRMTQFKEKASSSSSSVMTNREDDKTLSANMGLLAYPVLMAADVLLYDTDEVPVGHDQMQHLELTRDLVDYMRKTFGIRLKHPKAVYPKQSELSRVMSLTDGSRKMSKSDPHENSRILLTDSAEAIAKKISRAKTDSLGPVATEDFFTDAEGFRARRPEVANLLALSHAVSPLPRNTQLTIRAMKEGLIDGLVREIGPVASEIARLRRDEDYLLRVASEGNARAAERAEKTMREIRKAVGLIDFTQKRTSMSVQQQQQG